MTLYDGSIKAHAAIPKVVRKDPCRRRVAAKAASGECFVDKDTDSNHLWDRLMEEHRT
ncbi:MAG: hypothetical protein K6A38_11035 [Lachnospiraceae bacterium]|nr:hypothetical protein [Lachnospiraceae bacterium]